MRRGETKLERGWRVEGDDVGTRAGKSGRGLGGRSENREVGVRASGSKHRQGS